MFQTNLFGGRSYTPVHSSVRAVPFLKWIGGKNRLIKRFLRNMPDEFNDYYEPFVGGGSMYFALHDIVDGSCYLSDNNELLIATYESVRDEPNEVIKIISRLIDEYYAHPDDLLDTLRPMFDRVIAELNNPLSPAALRSANFIYMTYASFRGIWYMKQGLIVASVGNINIKEVKEVITNRLLKATEVLNQETFIQCKDYHKIEPDAGDFVYLDPPYDTMDEVYIGQFNRESQEQLLEFIDSMDRRGVYLMISNTYNEFTAKLYAHYKTKLTIDFRYSLGNTPDNVKTEFLVMNY